MKIQTMGSKSVFLDAVFDDNFDVAGCELENDPSVIDAQTVRGENALHQAQTVKMANFLLEKKPQLIDELTKNDESVLHVAAKCGDVDLTEFYLHQKPDLIYYKNKQNETALQLAYVQRAFPVVNFILNRSPDLVDVDCQGNTTLHIAIRSFCNTRVISKVFFHNIANLYRTNNQNDTPFDIAVYNKQKELINLFQMFLTFEMIDNPEHNWIYQKFNDFDIEFAKFYKKVRTFGLSQLTWHLKRFLLPDITKIVANYVILTDKF